MPNTTFAKNAMRDHYKTLATHGVLFTTVPSGDTPGTEVSGGSPAYARKPITWTNGSAGVMTGTVVHDTPAATVVAVGLYDAASGGNFLGWVDNPDVTVTSQNTVTVNWSYTYV